MDASRGASARNATGEGVLSRELVEAKRFIVRLVQSLSRGRAVDVFWWEPSKEVLTIYIEGHLSKSGTTRTSHTFDRDQLARYSHNAIRAVLQDEIGRVVDRFAKRTPP